MRRTDRSDVRVCVFFRFPFKEENWNLCKLHWITNLYLLFAAAPCWQKERISLPAAGIYGDGQQSQLEIQIRACRVCLLFIFHFRSWILSVGTLNKFRLSSNHCNGAAVCAGLFGPFFLTQSLWIIFNFIVCFYLNLTDLL